MLHLPQLGITRLDGFGFWYDWGMGNIKKQADAQVRIYKSTRKRLSACVESRRMIGPTGAVRVMVATKPVDFRKGAEGLAALVRERSCAVAERRRSWSRTFRCPCPNRYANCVGLGGCAVRG